MPDLAQGNDAAAGFNERNWVDDEEKHAVNTPESIEDFCKTNGKKYAHCFKTPYPFYAELDALYDGLHNRATDENVVRFNRRRSRTKKTASAVPSDKENEDDDAIGPGPTVGDGNAQGAAVGQQEHCVPMGDVNGGIDSRADNTGMGAVAGPYNDELVVSPVKVLNKRQRAESDNNDASSSKGKRECQTSRSSSSSVACRNAEAGSQISCSLDSLSATMEKPIITTEDLTHVDQIIEILQDKTLLPPNPKGKLFRLVSSALSRDKGLARIFVKEEDVVRCKGIIEGILEEAGVDVPEDY
ncbi:hypothetical protein B0H13DRAFT_2326488 [Mycena leptocephala]|nr:hypothetical protein B0H13DRAFT_2326488 [Mycena leptocephala]